MAIARTRFHFPVRPTPAIRPPATAPVTAPPTPSAHPGINVCLDCVARAPTARSAIRPIGVPRGSAWTECAATARVVVACRATRPGRWATAQPSLLASTTPRAEAAIPPPAATPAFVTALARARSTRKTRCVAPLLARAWSRTHLGPATARAPAEVPSPWTARPTFAPMARVRPASSTRTVRLETNVCCKP